MGNPMNRLNNWRFIQAYIYSPAFFFRYFVILEVSPLRKSVSIPIVAKDLLLL